MSDDFDREIARLMRELDPYPRGQDRELTAADLAVRDRILVSAAAPPARSPRRRKPRLFHLTMWVAPVAATMTIVFVMVALSGAFTPAAALTPAPLAYRDDGATIGDVVKAAESRLDSVTGPLRAVRHVESVGWYYRAEDVDTAAPTAVIRPEETTLTWREDLSGHTRTVAGQPYWADDSDEPIPSSTSPAGTVLWEMAFEPGQFQSPVLAVPGDDAAGVRALLEGYGLNDPTSAFDVMNVAQTAMEFWTLTNGQHAEILRLLLATEDARVLGSAVDRVGRPVVGLAATRARGPELHLLVSQTTGRVVGFETIATEADDPIPEGAVISYRLWEAAAR